MQARELIVDVPAPEGKSQKQLASPVRFSATPPSYRHVGMSIGANTDEVLSQNGFSTEQIATLRKIGAIL